MIPNDLNHFEPYEFKAPSAAVATQLCYDLDALRDKVDKKCVIHCTYDTDGHAPKSRHKLSPCDAADLHFEDADPAMVLRHILAGPWGGVGWYPHWAHPGWHLDLRPGARTFWVGTADGYVYGLPVLLKAVGLTLEDVTDAGPEPSLAYMQIHQFTALAEGGDADDPNDHGGRTRYGISWQFLRQLPVEQGDINHDGIIDLQDLAALTPNDAARLMWLSFWEALRLDGLPSLTAGAVYDFAVNSGPVAAVKALQQSLNFYPGVSLFIDGRMGPKTVAAAGVVAPDAAKDLTLACRVINVRRAYLRGIYAKDATQPIKGWLNRCDNLEAYVTKLAGSAAKVAA